MVNKPLIRPYFLGGVALGGGSQDSYEYLTPSKKHHLFRSEPAILAQRIKSACDFSVDLISKNVGFPPQKKTAAQPIEIDPHEN